MKQRQDAPVRSAEEIDAEMKAIRKAEKIRRAEIKTKLATLKAEKPDRKAEVAKRFKLEIELREKNLLPDNLGLITIGEKDAIKRAQKIADLKKDGLL